MEKPAQGHNTQEDGDKNCNGDPWGSRRLTRRRGLQGDAADAQFTFFGNDNGEFADLTAYIRPPAAAAARTIEVPKGVIEPVAKAEIAPTALQNERRPGSRDAGKGHV